MNEEVYEGDDRDECRGVFAYGICRTCLYHGGWPYYDYIIKGNRPSTSPQFSTVTTVSVVPKFADQAATLCSCEGVNVQN